MIDDLQSSSSYQSYLRARHAVLRMKGAPLTGAAAPSAYWSEELENIDYMLDASPLIVRKLRHHAFQITGVRPYDYRDKGDGRPQNFARRLEVLRTLGGEALLVPESPELGGFGYTIGDRLFNIDTLKFYEVLIAMERGGVLAAIRRTERPLVCEIGAGWGGFAYQFKTLFPRATYVIVDFPELFLFSATYLGAVFPNARMLFVGGDASDPSIEGWRDADFVFVPHTQSNLVSTLPLDLTLNMVSFQEMTDAQVRGYVAMAAAAQCPLLYSMNQESSLYNRELVSVSDALAEWYRLTDIPVLESDYTGAFKNKNPQPAQAVDKSVPRYLHLVGRLTSAKKEPDLADTASVAPVHEDSALISDPRVILGMTLYNNAEHLRLALDSLLAQTYRDYALLLLDDASADGTEDIARQYAERDTRIRYVRHAERQAMIATWREVAERAARDYPSAEYFAWVSDHDSWHPRWLERLVAELDANPDAVLAYPITQRVSATGDALEKGARLFDTADLPDLAARWEYFCRAVIGAGDMVYGVMRMHALQRAGTFRPVLRPDRLLIAELTLQGRIHQVPEVLWFRRDFGGASVHRQPTSLMLPGTAPRWFFWPPWLQHALVLWREYVAPEPRPLPITRAQWMAMLLRYQLTFGWRHFRRTRTAHALGRGIDNVVWTKKVAKQLFHRVVYEVLMLTYRLGLRGREGHR
jgi:hypothetical protein